MILLLSAISLGTFFGYAFGIRPILCRMGGGALMKAYTRHILRFIRVSHFKADGAYWVQYEVHTTKGYTGDIIIKILQEVL